MPTQLGLAQQQVPRARAKKGLAGMVRRESEDPAVLEGETGQSEPEADGPSFPASPPAFSLPSYH